MSLLSLSEVSFAYACAAPLLEGVSFSINPHDRIALVGPNGAGKSTLLGLIAGRLDPSRGGIARRRGLTIALAGQDCASAAAQSLFDFAEATTGLAPMRSRIAALEGQLSGPAVAAAYAELINEYQERGGFQAEAAVARTLSGLGFHPSGFDRGVQSLSGGERMRAELARAISTPADLLILDEPTNHLDAAARDWLAEALNSRTGASIVASHDRSLLSAFAGRIIEVDEARARVFESGYVDYRRARALMDAQAWGAYEAFQRRKAAVERAAQRRDTLAGRVARTPGGIRGGKDHYARKAAKVARTARILRSRVSDSHRVEKPWEDPPIDGLTFDRMTRSGDLVLVAEGLAKSFAGRTLFRGLSFHLRRGGRLVIRGANGSGKTTLLKIIEGSLPPDQGSVQLGAHVEPAVVAQDLAALDAHLSPFEICGSDLAARTLLACLKLRRECLNRPLRELSGGERTKVALARILNSRANLLLLDEPTNHLEIEAQEALELALRLYPGTVIAVSHDSFFIEALGSDLGPKMAFLDL